VVALVYIPTNIVSGFLFPCIPASICCFIFLTANLTGVRCNLSVALICISSMDKDVEYCFMYSFIYFYVLWVKWESLLRWKSKNKSHRQWAEQKNRGWLSRGKQKKKIPHIGGGSQKGWVLIHVFISHLYLFWELFIQFICPFIIWTILLLFSFLSSLHTLFFFFVVLGIKLRASCMRGKH
jgi:hypothetical protein